MKKVATWKHLQDNPKADYDLKNSIPKQEVKHGTGSIMIWGFFSANSKKQLNVVKR